MATASCQLTPNQQVMGWPYGHDFFIPQTKSDKQFPNPPITPPAYHPMGVWPPAELDSATGGWQEYPIRPIS